MERIYGGTYLNHDLKSIIARPRYSHYIAPPRTNMIGRIQSALGPLSFRVMLAQSRGDARTVVTRTHLMRG
jgi:hypothetical protein